MRFAARDREAPENTYQSHRSSADLSHVHRVSAVILVALGLSVAQADPKSTCERLEEEARAEAATLYAPRVIVEGARAPSVVDTSDPVAREGLQARAALSWSAIDALRGRAVERIAAAECARERAVDRASNVLGTGMRIGELAATRAEIAFRESKLPDVDALIAEASARFAAQRATAYEVEELRERRGALRVRLAALRHTASVLGELDPAIPEGVDLAALANDAAAAEVATAQSRASLRSLSAWRLDVRTGVAAGDGADWFAVVELGYSLGQPWQRGANQRAIAAREREIAADRHAIPQQIEQLRRAMTASTRALATEVAMLDDEIATVRRERERVATQQTDPGRQLVARFTLELIELEARRTYIEALAAARRPFAGEN
ncbi:MAG: hypothetical protein AB7T06_38850 [Kofleriaceae bacterium]